MIKYLLVSLILFGHFAISPVQAQTDRDYVIALQWMRMQEFEKAKDLLVDLTKKQPVNQTYLQQLLVCYVQLKEYDEGIKSIQNAPESLKGLYLIQNEWANLHHLSGKQEEAYKIWDDLLQGQSGNMAMYQTVANTMMERREFKRAAAVYKTARKQLKNAYLYLNELANAYLQASEYREAAVELLTILESNPNRLDMIQRQFSRYNDEYLYDEAIITLEESDLLQSSSNENLAQSKRELLLWMYMERGLEKKALRWAMQLEKKYPADYYVYNVAQNLFRRESFDLAELGYDFYLTKQSNALTVVVMEAKATIYLNWAEYLENKGLSILGKPDSLFSKAAELFENVVSNAPDIETRVRVLIKLIDLNLEQLANQSKARKWYATLLKTPQESIPEDEKSYLLGRFSMLDADFRNARIELTRANKNASNADMLEKSRYYLALNDFFAGDFEFAKIQLKSVERQKTSFYTNDAVALRNWIRKGIQKDSVTPELVTFSQAMLAYSRHEFKAVEQVLNTSFDSLYSLQPDAVSILTNVYRKSHPEQAYDWLGSYKGLKDHEQLFFDRIALGFALTQKGRITTQKPLVESEMKLFLSNYPNSIHAESIRNYLKLLEDVES